LNELSTFFEYLKMDKVLFNFREITNKDTIPNIKQQYNKIYISLKLPKYNMRIIIMKKRVKKEKFTVIKNLFFLIS
tara:strand:+ start:146 stop:373 length:228 start_codon:yes stop_codon:yes gene_type:complete